MVERTKCPLKREKIPSLWLEAPLRLMEALEERQLRCLTTLVTEEDENKKSITRHWEFHTFGAVYESFWQRPGKFFDNEAWEAQSKMQGKLLCFGWAIAQAN